MNSVWKVLYGLQVRSQDYSIILTAAVRCGVQSQSTIEPKRVFTDIPLLQDKKLLEIKSHALELLNVLLEETSSQSYELLHGISQDIAIDTILEAMLALWVSAEWDMCLLQEKGSLS